LIYGQLLRFPQILPFLVRGDFKFIHLIRRNVADAVISAYVAKESKRAHHYVGKEEHQKHNEAHINKWGFWLRIKKRLLAIRVARIILTLLPVQSTEVFYEDIVSDKKIELRFILNFLDLNGPDSWHMDDLTKKILKEPPSSFVQNWCEIAAIYERHSNVLKRKRSR
jgi:hypothetical protein